jgi:hypothetical protein
MAKWLRGGYSHPNFFLKKFFIEKEKMCKIGSFGYNWLNYKILKL